MARKYFTRAQLEKRGRNNLRVLVGLPSDLQLLEGHTELDLPFLMAEEDRIVLETNQPIYDNQFQEKI